MIATGSVFTVPPSGIIICTLGASYAVRYTGGLNGTN